MKPLPCLLSTALKPGKHPEGPGPWQVLDSGQNSGSRAHLGSLCQSQAGEPISGIHIPGQLGRVSRKAACPRLFQSQGSWCSGV